ncbi:putative ubiquitin-like activating enzyme protein [Venturia nashicola]|uniref:NEDD8-activating enzyme E1 regulatory subunit n=1 Tax=Venturia nashicola TaxID=86259 RepID=A0A4Z1PB75_9PEZI|nr:putative ubiquitin-like activating enzyme protein [Venturia nashicola]
MTPPVLHGPSAKEKKYDRQLRLWAASGQAALEDAHLLLVQSEDGAGVIGIETLKNLVLPGVGQYTILDSAIVKEEDLGVNFFLDEESLGSSRASATCKFLQELNPDVQGHYINQPASTIINEDFLKPYSLLLVSAPVDPNVLATLSSYAAKTSIPLFYMHCVGFYAHFSVALPSAWPIVDTHPDPVSTTDLRLVKPWPELLEFMQSRTGNLEAMENDDHGHVPYLLLLSYYLEEWRKTHEGKVPSAYKEKQEFRDLVRKGMRTDTPEGSEENYEEAISAVLKSLNEPTASSAVREVWDAEECKNLTHDSHNFWIISSAIAKFYRQHGMLPLPGSVPDMKARSADYIALQNVYKSKARADILEITASVRELEKSLARKNAIEASEIEAFCKNAAHIKLVRGKPLAVYRVDNHEWTWGDRAKFAFNTLSDETSLILLHIAFMAWDAFFQSSTKVAGASEPDTDAIELTKLADSIMDGLVTESGRSFDEGESDSVRSKLAEFCQELSRAGGAELHNLASLAGGLIAQEVIKAITKQYIPVDNTCLFDGVRSSTSVLKL